MSEWVDTPGSVLLGTTHIIMSPVYLACNPFILGDDLELITPAHIRRYMTNCMHPIGVDQCDVKVFITCHCFL